MNVLIVGSGAREHALAWKLHQDPAVGAIYVAPGNGGTASLARNLKIGAIDSAALVQAALDYDIGLVVLGGETSIAAGVADACALAGIPCFGPGRDAGQIESSKAFTKALMAEAGVPTAAATVFDDVETALEYVRNAQRPLVIKADGLAAGKGVTVAWDTETALEAVSAAMVDGVFGVAGAQVVIEEVLTGTEMSYHVFSDGERFAPMVAVCDYKRVFDGDEGANTGSMGCYTPPGFFNPDLAARIDREIIEPVLRVLRERGTPFRGALYAGLMVEDGVPRVVEFNARFGDPETQVILPLLENDLLPILLACASGGLDPSLLRWSTDAALAVVIASGGYPAGYTTGYQVRGLQLTAPDALVFQAGTRVQQSLSYPPLIETSGGRVLTVVGRGETLLEAHAAAYRIVPQLHFTARHYRTDIGLREFVAAGVRPLLDVAPPPPPRKEQMYEPMLLVPGSDGARKKKRRRRGKRGGRNADGSLIDPGEASEAGSAPDPAPEVVG